MFDLLLILWALPSSQQFWWPIVLGYFSSAQTNEKPPYIYIYIYILEWTRAYTCTVFCGSKRTVDPVSMLRSLKRSVPRVGPRPEPKQGGNVCPGQVWCLCRHGPNTTSVEPNTGQNRLNATSVEPNTGQNLLNATPVEPNTGQNRLNATPVEPNSGQNRLNATPVEPNAGQNRLNATPVELNTGQNRPIRVKIA